MQYFTKVTQAHWNEKNKAEEAARKYAFSCERMILEDHHVPGFIEVMKLSIEKINEEHSRCKPLELHKFPYRLNEEDKDIVVFIEQLFYFTFYAIREIKYERT